MGKIGQNDSDFDFFQLRDYPESPGGAAGCSLGRQPQVRGSQHPSPLISTPAAAPTPGSARSWGGGRGGKALGGWRRRVLGLTPQATSGRPHSGAQKGFPDRLSL